MKHMTKCISLFLTAVLLIGMCGTLAIPASAAAKTNPYSEAAMALDREYAYDGELGAIYSPDETTFRVWAPLATAAAVNRYATGSDGEVGAQNLGTVEMEKLMDGGEWTGVWTATVQGDLKNTYYTYTLTNPAHIYTTASPDEVSYTARETQDVYSYAVGVNGDRTMIVDLDDTDPDGWESDMHIFVDEQTDAIVWEVQVKDFSWDENSGVSADNRGKYLAFTETGTTLDGEGSIATCVDYLKELGVTHVQINPFYDFATIDESGDPAQFNWGYDPKNYGVPEGSYSSNPYDGGVRINECKQMIQALHEAGIGVIMDVVFNHTYSIDSCFTCTVPEYYYRLNDAGVYSSGSGCGNDTASERAMFRRYMRDMLAYWVDEYHIDGFRFDLMGLHDVETMNLIREDMDAIDSRIILYGEGWDLGSATDSKTCTGADVVLCTNAAANRKVADRIGFFNDQLRDGIKAGVFSDSTYTPGFVSGDRGKASDISIGVQANTTGSDRNWSAASPAQCVSYASCHDNMTIYDKLVCVNHPGSDYRERYSDCIKQNKLTAAIISTCQGIDFILAGEEMGRSKDGDDNSYKSAASLNMIDWSLLKTNADLVSYYKGLFELRKAFSPFTASKSDAKDNTYKYFRHTSLSASTYTIAYTVENLTPGEWNKIAVIYNGGTSDASVTLSATTDKSLSSATEWVIVADGGAAGVTALYDNVGLTFEVPASSCIVAVEKSTFEACALKSAFSRVVVNNVYEKKGTVINSVTLLGTPGEGYYATRDDSVPLEYEYTACDGEESGVFTDGVITVNYNYTDFVPESLKAPYGDVDGDGLITIFDATIIQRYLVGLEQLDSEHEGRADYDYSGDITVFDATMLQRHLVGIQVGVYKITSSYKGQSGETESYIAPTKVQRVRIGTKYEIQPESVAYYVLTEMPENASGVVSGDVKITFNYVYSVKSPVIHVKHDGNLTWAPSLWAWVYEASGSPINAYDGWPGYKMSDPDEDGWYTTTFPIPGGLDYYIIFSNDGNPQTEDYGPISYDDYPEIWVIIHDSKVFNQGKWITYYNYNPDLEN